MRPRFLDLSLHLARVAFSALGLGLAVHKESAVFGAGASIALFFASFALMHDAAHGALRLPRRANELLLAASGSLMLMSGHALRLMHLRHHARPLAEDDLEGNPARLSLPRAALTAPLAAVALRVEALRAAGPRGRRAQIAESLGNALALALLLASQNPALVAGAAAALTLQLTMSVWAAHIPHNAPAWLLAAARRAAFTRSPIALSLAFHEVHHRRPSVPCGRLANQCPIPRARALG
ncbi:MAG TPA: fatty acid desaturase [Polyangiaceae bacterium]|jgi:fatty acid desaturase|nr:fatty acid desaturase [Polyangiaceae bacterium]